MSILVIQQSDLVFKIFKRYPIYYSLFMDGCEPLVYSENSRNLEWDSPISKLYYVCCRLELFNLKISASEKCDRRG